MFREEANVEITFYTHPSLAVQKYISYFCDQVRGRALKTSFNSFPMKSSTLAYHMINIANG